MQQSVFLYSEIDKSAECRQIVDLSAYNHPGFQITYAHERLVEMRSLHIAARIAPRFFQFFQHKVQGGETHCLVQVIFGINRFKQPRIADKSVDGSVEVFCDLGDQSV